MTQRRGFLSGCENEPLHRSGAVQPHGALLVCDTDDRVTHASENAPGFLGLTLPELLGAPVPQVVSPVLEALDRSRERRVVLGGMPVDERYLDLVAAFAPDGARTVELLPEAGEDHDTGASEPAFAAIADDHELAQRRQGLVQTLRAVTGFERGLYYQFLPEGDGAVVAEDRAPRVGGTFLGLHFPASDIPRIARNLYRQNPWRLIADCAADPVGVVGAADTVPDLSHVDLRSVSPVHRAYMRNMGLRASVSFPVVLDQELSALVVCHGTRANALGLATLEQARARVSAFNTELRDFVARRRIQVQDRLQHEFRAPRRILRAAGGLQAAWDDLGPWLTEHFACDAAVLCTNHGICPHGAAVAEDEIHALDRWFIEAQDELVVVTNHLRGLAPHLVFSNLAGVAAVRLGPQRNGLSPRIYLLRGEHIHEVSWGGNPDKPAETGVGGEGIAPRRSFERWVEKRLGYSRPWPSESRLRLFRLRGLLQEELADDAG